MIRNTTISFSLFFNILTYFKIFILTLWRNDLSEFQNATHSNRGWQGKNTSDVFVSDLKDH